MVNVIPREEYPRPQFYRKDWLNLNGLWQFSFDDHNIGESEQWYLQDKYKFDQEILVPFSFESNASKIGDVGYHPFVWYKRDFVLPQEYSGKRVVINFQAVDYKTKVWVNGQFVGQHNGGYTPFSFDITSYINNKLNFLVVKAEDNINYFQPRGKQSWKDENFGCWYSRTTGIWQSVWLEFLDQEAYFEKVKITPDVDNGSIKLEYFFNENLSYSDFNVKTIIYYKGEKIKEFGFVPNNIYENINVQVLDTFIHYKPLWTPENPNLFDIKYSLYKEDLLVDKVESYFGMRKISIKDGMILLNNKPIYQKLILDQGYWPESLLTPPSDESIIKDIELAKKMGFNGARKHQKVEDERYYYWCDQMGFLVWCEMGAACEYSDVSVANFTQEWLEIVRHKYNHPSIIIWTPFNESWGISNVLNDKAQQSFTEAIYYLTKSIDTERPVIVNDGWEHTISDIITLHDYEEDSDVFFRRYKLINKILNNEVPHNTFKGGSQLVPVHLRNA